jgi:chloramphenicol O-acetyltransferase
MINNTTYSFKNATSILDFDEKINLKDLYLELLYTKFIEEYRSKINSLLDNDYLSDDDVNNELYIMIFMYVFKATHINILDFDDKKLNIIINFIFKKLITMIV